MAIALISDHVGTNPTVTSKWPALISDMEGTESSNHDRMAQPLHMTCFLEWFWISSLIYDMEGTKSYHQDRMAHPLHLTLSQNGWHSHLTWKETILSP